MVLGLALLANGIERSLAWGDNGHQVIAAIAWRYLTQTSRDRVREILDSIKDAPRLTTGEENFVAAAIWADRIRLERRHTGPYHFVDIPLREDRYVAERDCRKDDCLIVKLSRYMANLRGIALRQPPHEDVPLLEALRWVIHLVGDIHQPLHVSDNNDAAGNTVQVRFFERNASLHFVWDSLILEQMMGGVGSRPRLSSIEFADVLFRQIGGDEFRQWSGGDPVAWAEETHALARVAYEGISSSDGRVSVLGSDYFQSSSQVITLQLKRAGVRLARIINGDR